MYTPPWRTRLELLGHRHHLQFDINETAFRLEMLNEVLQSKIANAALPGMRGSLRIILKKILSRVPSPSGATFLVRPDRIEITTEDAVRAELRLPAAKRNAEGVTTERLPPLTSEDFRKVPLDRALEVLAEATETNIVLDPRIEEKASVLITARLLNVPVETAIELLVEMAGLAVVRRDNVYYVTTAENAERFAQRRRNADRGDACLPLAASRSRNVLAACGFALEYLGEREAASGKDRLAPHLRLALALYTWDARPFPGLRCAPPWATFRRPSGAL